MGPAPGRFELVKGHLEVNIRNGIWDPQLESKRAVRTLIGWGFSVSIPPGCTRDSWFYGFSVCRSVRTRRRPPHRAHPRCSQWCARASGRRAPRMLERVRTSCRWPLLRRRAQPSVTQKQHADRPPRRRLLPERRAWHGRPALEFKQPRSPRDHEFLCATVADQFELVGYRKEVGSLLSRLTDTGIDLFGNPFGFVGFKQRHTDHAGQLRSCSIRFSAGRIARSIAAAHAAYARHG